MPLPYTESPLGSLLALLGQGIPALAQQHRQRGIQDTQLDLQRQEAESRLKTEGLHQQTMQEQLNDLPIQRERGSFEFAKQLDPVAAIMQLQKSPTLSKILPQGYMPGGLVNQAKQQQFQGSMIDSLLGGGQPQANGAAPSQANGVDNGINSLSMPRKMRMAGLLSGPETPQEAAEVTSAKKLADINVERATGQLPQADQKFVDDAMTYYSQLQNAQRAVNDPRVQKGGMPSMQFQRMLYKLGVGNAQPYDQLIPALDMGKQQILSDLAGGIRNAKVRSEIGTHLPGSEDSPLALQQRIDNIVKYYPYMVYSRYASRGATMPDQVMRGMGYEPQAFKQYVQSLDADKPQEVGQQVTTGIPAQADLLKSYADQFFGGDMNAARQAAAASIANRGR